MNGSLTARLQHVEAGGAVHLTVVGERMVLVFPTGATARYLVIAAAHTQVLASSLGLI